MNQYLGESQPGEVMGRCTPFVGTIDTVRGAQRISFLLPDGTPIYTDTPDGPVQFAETLSYDVLVEALEGPILFERVRPINPQWPNPIKVRIPNIGDHVFGFRVGDQCFLWILPMPDFGPCDTAPPPAGAAAASIAPPAGPTPPPREVPGEVPYDPSQDPVIIDNSKGYTSGPETDSLPSTSGDA